MKHIDKNSLFKVISAPFLISVIAIILFFIVSLIPQSAIQANASRSAKDLMTQSQYPYAFIPTDSYLSDNYTDSQILMQSYNLTSQNPISILSNPKHVSSTGIMANALDEVVNHGAENEMNYVRYWMGFRIYIRPLLTLFSYFDIRKLIAFIFYFLAFASILTIQKHRNTSLAFMLGACVIFVNPSVISHSLQFSCCFILTFLFIHFIFLAEKKQWNYALLFCCFGALTQLFDFYTTPIITWGIPVIVLIAADTYQQNRLQLTGKTLLSWGYGYGSMWLIKLLLVTIFSDINGFTDGFSAFAGRTGITIVEGLEERYNVIEMLKAVKRVAFHGKPGTCLILLFIIMTLIGIIHLLMKRDYQKLFSTASFLIIAAIPVLWFICATQPTYIHAWFQYRSVTVILFGVVVFIAKTFPFGKSKAFTSKM